MENSEDGDIVVEYHYKPIPISSPNQSHPPKLEIPLNRHTSPKRLSRKSKVGKIPPSDKSPQKTIHSFFKKIIKTQPVQGRISVRKDLMASTSPKKNVVRVSTPAPQSPKPSSNEASRKLMINETNKPLDMSKTAQLQFPEIVTLSGDSEEQDLPNRTPTKKSPRSENVTLSPGIKRSINRFKSISPAKSPARKKIILGEDNSPSRVIPVVSNYDPLIFMIEEVKRNQSLLKRSTNQNMEPLFSPEEESIIESYLSLTPPAQTLFVKRFFGVDNWHRLDEDGDTVKELSEKQFLDTNSDNMNLLTLIGLLNNNELTQIHKNYARVRKQMKNKKSMIESILQSARTQNNPFGKSREMLLISEIRNKLGKIYIVSEKSRVAMNRVVLLFSVVHSIEAESKRAQGQRFFISKILRGEIKFPTYQVIPVVLFKTRAEFIEYESALSLKKRLEEALEIKDFASLEPIAGEAKASFERILNDDTLTTRVSQLPSFLTRYTAGSVLASVLTLYCKRYKKEQNSDYVISILKLLLEQSHFGIGRRGSWYELLCQAHLTAKNPVSAAEILNLAELDLSLDEVWILTLQLKVQRLAKVV